MRQNGRMNDALMTPPALEPAPSLRWGILGPGWIAQRFAAGLAANTAQRVTAVGSRDAARAIAFADSLASSTPFTPTPHASATALVADPQVDVVYIATPHPNHLDAALLAIAAGKHVLVEKPLGMNAEQADRIREAARAHGVFAMEAVWTFFLPKFAVLRRLIENGVLGEITSVVAEHGEYFEPGHRILRADLAGGPLLDLGTYPVALANWALGTPLKTLAVGSHHPGFGDGPGEVHAQVTMANEHAGGAQSAINTTILATTPAFAVLGGREASVTMPRYAYEPGDFTVRFTDGREPWEWREPNLRHAELWHEADAVARAIGEGRTEHPFRTLDASVQTLATIDAARGQLGIRYPGE